MKNDTDKQQSCEFNVDATSEEQNSNSGLIVKIIAEVQRQKNTSNQSSESATTESPTTETVATNSENQTKNTRENVPDITPVSDGRTEYASVVPEKTQELPEIEQPKNIDADIKPENQPNKKDDNRSIPDQLIKPINLIKNEIQKLSKEFLKTFEREKKQFDIQEKMLLSVEKIEKGLETDRLAQKETEKEQEDKVQDVRIVGGMPTVEKKDEEGGFFSKLFAGLGAGLTSLLGMIPGLDTFKNLLVGIPTLLSSLGSGLSSLIGVLANPVFLTLAGIAAGIAAIVYELKLAGEMISETNKLEKDTQRLSGQLTKQSEAGVAAAQARVDREIAETGSASKVGTANLDEAKYLETENKIKEIELKLKGMPRQYKVGRGADVDYVDNEEYFKLEKEKQALQNTAKEQYKKTQESKQNSKQTYFQPLGTKKQQNIVGSSESLLQALTGVKPQAEIQTSLNRPIFAESPNKPLSIAESIKESYQNVFFDPVSDSIKNMQGGTFGVNPNLNISPLSTTTPSNIEIIKDTGQGLQAGASNALATYTGLTEEQNRQMQENANRFYNQSSGAQGPVIQNIDQSNTVYDSSAPYYRDIDDAIRRRN